MPATYDGVALSAEDLKQLLAGVHDLSPDQNIEKPMDDFIERIIDGRNPFSEARQRLQQGTLNRVHLELGMTREETRVAIGLQYTMLVSTVHKMLDDDSIHFDVEAGVSGQESRLKRQALAGTPPRPIIVVDFGPMLHGGCRATLTIAGRDDQRRKFMAWMTCWEMMQFRLGAARQEVDSWFPSVLERW